MCNKKKKQRDVQNHRRCLGCCGLGKDLLFYAQGGDQCFSALPRPPPLQAFLELGSEECAQTMVSYYSSVTPVIRNHPIYMQYSTHKELKTDNSPNQVVRPEPDTSTRHELRFHLSSSFIYAVSDELFMSFTRFLSHGLLLHIANSNPMTLK